MMALLFSTSIVQPQPEPYLLTSTFPDNMVQQYYISHQGIYILYILREIKPTMWARCALGGGKVDEFQVELENSKFLFTLEETPGSIGPKHYPN